MYQILVVDDHRIEVETITWLIEKYRLPLVVTQASNGHEALRHLEDYPTDILITDIKMPFLDGIELARQAKKLRSSVRIVIYSAYGEFEFARQAIEIGVLHYIMKPLVPANFLEVMNQVIEACNQDARTFEQYKNLQVESLFHALLHGYEWNKEMHDHLAFSNTSLNNSCLHMILVDTYDPLFDTCGKVFEAELSTIIREQYVTISLNERQSVIILCYPPHTDVKSNMIAYAEHILHFIEQEYGKQCFIVIGNEVHKPEQLHLEFNRMEEHLNYRFYMDGSVIWDMGHNIMETVEGIAMDVETELNSIYRQIEQFDYNTVRNSIAVLVRNIRQSGTFSPLFSKLIFTGLLRKIHEHANQEQRPLIVETLRQIDKVMHIDRLQGLLLTIVDQLAELKETSSEEQNRKVIHQVADYIAEHYGEDIGLDQIAARYNFSPSHMAYLFKKSMGRSVGKYLTEIRMERARELLRTTFLKSAEVGRRVGYPNPSYFTMMFKNRYGTTPAQYREKVR
ncbi:response regulator [Paenibacillus sp. GCM10023252]|uniref:response regulator n=1 Tax=Paenibacillus sp. GCM10023252 TaxID=3252649 RepID=UPI0036148AD1